MKLNHLLNDEYSEISSHVETLIKKPDSSGVKKILDLYQRWYLPNYPASATGQILDDAFFTRDDLLQFCMRLDAFQDHADFQNTGAFLSILTNLHYEKTKTIEPYILLTNHLKNKIMGLGTRNNGATIHILGDAEQGLCNNMTSGTVIVDGNVANFAAREMTSGKLIINGDCGSFACDRMYGGIFQAHSVEDFLGHNLSFGKIYVQKAGSYIGEGMIDGEIHINESYKSLSTRLLEDGKIGLGRGKIFHKGVQIFPEEKK